MLVRCCYGTVPTFFRLTNSKGEVCVSFVFGKARVAPLKCTTIPRKELAAAVLAVRLDHMLRRELQFTLANSIFWSDSMTVLQYIANRNKRKRMCKSAAAIIHSLSKVEQWKHICSKANPADQLQRVLSAKVHFFSIPNMVQRVAGPLMHTQWPETKTKTWIPFQMMIQR
ncbi:hypothetical protein QQF64_009052 [Cirrhinus molitorella]|uniref:Uncharacterized protein n=1 Tax=Cirrhinus molitorella TaxID=172907 RepID=A0ABR3M8R6_9TELE